MPSLHLGSLQQAHYYVAGAWLTALVITLVLACWFTPASWWKRPTARGLFVLAGGTWAIASLMLWRLPGWPSPQADADSTPSASAVMPPMAFATLPAMRMPGYAPTPVAGQTYQVHQDLNLRSGAAVSARRIAVVPIGATVRTTGVQQGDWWQIRASVAGHDHLGWASSLWLRRTDETPAH